MSCKLKVGFCRGGFVLLVASVSLFLWGCFSVPTDTINPMEIEYVEINSAEYCKDIGSEITAHNVHNQTIDTSNIYSSQEELRRYYSGAQGYILTETYWLVDIEGLDIEVREENGTKELLITLAGETRGTYLWCKGVCNRVSERSLSKRPYVA